MTEKEKKRFADMAEKDKARYEKEMSTYTPPAGESGSKKRKKKDPNAPKRPLSAFFLFCHDERPGVKAIHPNYGVGDVAKELGERWNKVTPDIKQKYEAKAQLEKGRYEKDMANYKNKVSAKAQEVKIFIYFFQVDFLYFIFKYFYLRLRMTRKLTKTTTNK